MWDAMAIDALTETVVSRLLVEGESARSVAFGLAGRLAVESPDMPALSLALPFTLAAGALEEVLGAGDEARRAAHDAWRVAALIGADSLALRVQSRSDTIAALWDAWRHGDEVFRTDAR